MDDITIHNVRSKISSFRGDIASAQITLETQIGRILLRSGKPKAFQLSFHDKIVLIEQVLLSNDISPITTNEVIKKLTEIRHIRNTIAHDIWSKVNDESIIFEGNNRRTIISKKSLSELKSSFSYLDRFFLDFYFDVFDPYGDQVKDIPS